MFRQLALLIAPPPSPPSPDVAEQAAREVFTIHPIQLSRFLEEVWAARNPNLQILTPTVLEIPSTVPQVGLERDSGIRESITARQSVSISGGPTGGTFTLAFTPPGTTTPQTTAGIAINAPATGSGSVQASLEGLSGVGAGQVEATGGPLPAPVSVQFQNALASRIIAPMTADSTNLTGGTNPTATVETKSSLYPPSLWDHFIYAYMVENTRVYEIFQRVLEEYAYGERLGVPSDEGQRWLRTTEQIFYRDSPPFQIYTLASWIRPDIRAVRRNAYHRLFGLDLNHGTNENRPYPYPRAAATNADFTSTFEELSREVWRAIENVRNQVGPNQTDVSTIANLARMIFDMLRVRRQENVGNLARDELFHVSTMSWFHLTLSFNTPIVHDLKADASSAAERLQKIGERVGLPAHSRSDSYFQLATAMSLILREMELGTFNDPATGAPALFQPSTTSQPNPFQEAMQQIITHWTIATGRDLKAARVSVAPTAPTPVRPTPRPIVAAPSGNGRVGLTREIVPT
jgi:hypothetical protein